MFGPRIETGKDNAVVMREVQPQDLNALPEKLHPCVTQYVSSSTKRDLHELVVEHEVSNMYRSWQGGLSRVVWGIFVAKNQQERLVGFTGFTSDNTESSSQEWYSAESYSILFDPEVMGQGIATATHACRTTFAFAMGIDCLRSSVVKGNERSKRAIQSAGYALLGIAWHDLDGFERYEFRQYHPDSGGAAQINAESAAWALSSTLLEATAVENSKRHVAELMQAMPSVAATAKEWVAQHDQLLLYLPVGREQMQP